MKPWRSVEIGCSFIHDRCHAAFIDSVRRKNFGKHVLIRYAANKTSVIINYRADEEYILRSVCSSLPSMVNISKDDVMDLHFDARHLTLKAVKLYYDRLTKYLNTNPTSYDKYKTIQVVGQSSTIDPVSILKWVDVCERIMEDKL